MMKRVTSLIALAVITTNAAQAAVPTLATTFSTDVYVSNGTSSQRSKIDRAETAIREVISSEAFRTRVLNHTYNGRKTFVDNGGLTNSQIYMKILEGAEKLSPSRDNEMDLKIKTYYESSSTVGYTTTSSSWINMNTKFLNTYTVSETAKTMTHEWLHKLGFKHAVSYSNSRNYSVPYGVGKIIKELVAKL